ncbi:MAG: cysteine--tRNA ligase [Opitutales bacterium]
MVEVRLYDTLSREVRPLAAADGQRFRMYVCGPTVHGPAHIGNFLTFVRFDVLYRLVRAAGLCPHYVRNITDVDDKTIAKAQAAGLPLAAFTAQWTERFHEDCIALNLLPPDEEPRATAHLAEQIALVEALVSKGHAYVAADGSVYYRVTSFADYGKLSHFDPEMLRSQTTNSAGTRNQADEYERETIADFALWKAHKAEDGDNAWDSPWGPGRPGWHLECSAMSLKYLGSAIDLHGGGEDLCFPHHENEIAQSEAATGEPFCRHWAHGVHLLVEGKKMSKSLGNFFTVGDLIEKGFEPRALRLAMLGGHYRQQLNFTLASVEAATSSLERIEKAVARLLTQAGLDPTAWTTLEAAKPAALGPYATVWQALCDDLNFPAALGELHKALRSTPATAREATDALRGLRLLLAEVLGLELFTRADAPAEAPPEVAAKAAARWEAKQVRDWARADALRDEVQAAGWKILDRRDGYDLAPLD